MTTFGDLVSETMLQLEGFVNDQAVVGTLSSSIGAADVAFSVSTGSYPDGSGMSTGVWEIGEELVNVIAFNRSTGAVTNCIRGWRGTTATTHASGAMVVNNPRYPIAQVKKTINDTVRNMYPKVPAIKEEEVTMTYSSTRYELPADVKNILSVTADETPLRVWKFIPRPSGLTGTAIDIQASYSGPVSVVYAAEPGVMTANNDDFETKTGLPSFAREAVIWGAMWRLYSTVELGRGLMSTADQALLNTPSPIGKATDLAKYLLGMFQQASAEAEQRMQALYPVQKHYVW